LNDPPRATVCLLHLLETQCLHPRAVDRRLQHQDVCTLVRGPELCVKGIQIGMDRIGD